MALEALLRADPTAPGGGKCIKYYIYHIKYMALHDNELTIKSVCGNIHNVVPLQRCDCSLSSKITQFEIVLAVSLTFF